MTLETTYDVHDYIAHSHAPETKAGIARQEREVHDDLRGTFEAFKAANDERLASLSRGDVLLEEKVTRIDAALDEQMRRLEDIALKGARPPLDGARNPATDAAAREHKSAFDAYVRSGESGGLRQIETKAMSGGSNPDGGYLVPFELEREIGQRLAVLSPIRSIASVREISASVYKKPFMTAGPAVGWVGETDSRSQTTSPTLDALSFPAMELYAMPAATATLLDDAAVNIDEWIAAEVELSFAEQEGDGLRQRRRHQQAEGLFELHRRRAGLVELGQSRLHRQRRGGRVSGSDPSDALVDLVYALKAPYRQNATFVMNRKTQANDPQVQGRGRQLSVAAAAQAGGRASLMGFPLVEAEDMPDMAANSLSIAFGDFRRGYLIVDRQGVRVLRDPYSSKPYVLFYTTKRVGGGVQDFDAIKLMKFAAS
jgi:HK97 family phage major capsid protein